MGTLRTNLLIFYVTNNYERSFFKSKSDFVTQPISSSDLEDIWLKFMDRNRGLMIWDPDREKMSEIPENDNPYPHRAGNLFGIQYYLAVGRWQR